MNKRLVFVVGVIVVALFGYLAFRITSPATPVAIAATKTYSAVAHVAGHGGHFAVADVTIDPNNADNPIKLNSLNKIDIGTTATHKTHDPRIDASDSTILFWSTIAKDPQGKVHVGKTDLKTGKVLKDVALSLDPRAPGETGPLYCASGQSKKSYMPVFMGKEAYIDVFDKATMEHKHRVFISDLGYNPESYVFLHGSNSNDMKKFALAVTLATPDGKPSGKNDIILVDLPALEKGKLKELARVTLTGEPGKTITFRQFFTRDNKYLFQSAADRLYVLDANTLKIVDEKPTAGEDHDAMPTPDGKYALLTLRTNATAVGADGKAVEKDGKPVSITDGALQLYSFRDKKLVGNPVSTCSACHKNVGLADKTATLCGLNANYKQ